MVRQLFSENVYCPLDTLLKKVRTSHYSDPRQLEHSCNTSSRIDRPCVIPTSRNSLESSTTILTIDNTYQEYQTPEQEVEETNPQEESNRVMMMILEIDDKQVLIHIKNKNIIIKMQIQQGPNIYYKN